MSLFALSKAGGESGRGATAGGFSHGSGLPGKRQNSAQRLEPAAEEGARGAGHGLLGHL